MSEISTSRYQIDLFGEVLQCFFKKLHSGMDIAKSAVYIQRSRVVGLFYCNRQFFSRQLQ